MYNKSWPSTKKYGTLRFYQFWTQIKIKIKIKYQGIGNAREPFWAPVPGASFRILVLSHVCTKIYSEKPDIPNSLHN